ncbi:hypothetical protein (Partial), partial [Seminavis robusta]|eukprot:Sro3634_g349870.1 n/a (367) ;mRNA; r:2-1104
MLEQANDDNQTFTHTNHQRRWCCQRRRQIECERQMMEENNHMHGNPAEATSTTALTTGSASTLRGAIELQPYDVVVGASLSGVSSSEGESESSGSESSESDSEDEESEADDWEESESEDNTTGGARSIRGAIELRLHEGVVDGASLSGVSSSEDESEDNETVPEEDNASKGDDEDTGVVVGTNNHGQRRSRRHPNKTKAFADKYTGGLQRQRKHKDIDPSAHRVAARATWQWLRKKRMASVLDSSEAQVEDRDATDDSVREILQDQNVRAPTATAENRHRLSFGPRPRTQEKKDEVAKSSDAPVQASNISDAPVSGDFGALRWAMGMSASKHSAAPPSTSTEYTAPITSTENTDPLIRTESIHTQPV